MLKTLPAQEHPDLILGLNQADDSGVIRLDDERALILTLDFFPAIVDDPYVFGQVAAANALSDVYAMGGVPLAALNIVGFPQKDLPIEALGELLRGGAAKVNEAGAVIVGGHTIKDSELTYGLSVVGLVHPNGIMTLGGARPGGVLVLTKPIGTGIYSTALKHDALSPEQEEYFYSVMTMLNRVAAEEMKRSGATACTDVTGFGLLGHALEMAEASDVTIAIDAGAVPKLPGVLGLAEKGYLTAGGTANREYVKDKLTMEGELTPEMEMLLYDAQTSGGLLVAVPRDRADGFLESIHARGVRDAGIVGEVLAAADTRIVLRT